MRNTQKTELEVQVNRMMELAEERSLNSYRTVVVNEDLVKAISRAHQLAMVANKSLTTGKVSKRTERIIEQTLTMVVEGMTDQILAEWQ